MIIAGGLTTIFVGDMDAAVQFYTEVLEFKCSRR